MHEGIQINLAVISLKLFKGLVFLRNEKNYRLSHFVLFISIDFFNNACVFLLQKFPPELQRT